MDLFDTATHLSIRLSHHMRDTRPSSRWQENGVASSTTGDIVVGETAS